MAQISTFEGKITAVFEALEKASLLDALDLARKDIALKFWEEHKTEIMAKMNLEGLASLIAVYAAKEMVPKKD